MQNTTQAGFVVKYHVNNINSYGLRTITIINFATFISNIYNKLI